MIRCIFSRNVVHLKITRTGSRVDHQVFQLKEKDRISSVAGGMYLILEQLLLKEIQST